MNHRIHLLIGMGCEALVTPVKGPQLNELSQIKALIAGAAITPSAWRFRQ